MSGRFEQLRARRETLGAIETLISEQTSGADPIRAYLLSHKYRYTALLHILDRLALPAGNRLLEMGCSEGILSSYLGRRYGWRVVGVDSAVEAVEKARSRGIEAEVCDVDHSNLPFPDCYFRLVVCDSLLEHLYQPSRVFKEIPRVLAKDGYLVLGTPNAISIVQRLRHLAGQNPFATFNQFNAIENQAFMRQCAVFYTPQEVIAALDGEFEIERLQYTDLFAKFRERRSFLRNMVTPLRLALCWLYPPFSDFFYVVARRTDSPAH